MQCPKCGQSIRIGSRLCPFCGAWLGETDGRNQHDVPRSKAAFAAPDTFVIPPPGQEAAYTVLPATDSPIDDRPAEYPPVEPTAFPLAERPAARPPASMLGSLGPPKASQRVDQPAPFGVGGAEPGAYPPEFDEATTLSARRSKTQYWTLTLPNGTVELVTGRLVVGRQPEFMPTDPTARLIPVPDPTRSVSKNHACFFLAGSNLVVEDLGSTNGIIVTRPDGHEHDIGVRGRAELEDGSKVELGDVVLRIGKA